MSEDPRPTSRVVVAIVVAIAVIAMVVLHLTGVVGPGAPYGRPGARRVRRDRVLGGRQSRATSLKNVLSSPLAFCC
jgi:hypothetical protein